MGIVQVVHQSQGKHLSKERSKEVSKGHWHDTKLEKHGQLAVIEEVRPLEPFRKQRGKDEDHDVACGTHRNAGRGYGNQVA